MDPVGPAVVVEAINAVPLLSRVPPWTQVIVLVAAAALTAWLASKTVLKTVGGFTARTETTVDDIFFKRVDHPLTVLTFTLLTHLSVAPLQLSSFYAEIMRSSLVSLNLVAATYFFARLFGAAFEAWEEVVAADTETILDDTMLPILSKFVVVATWVFGGIFVLQSWGVQVGPLLAGVGIAGIAIGFAVRDSLSNIFGGISLALDKAYTVGDKLRLADGTVGVVHDITLRSTQIKTYDGDLIMIPNAKIANEPIQTYVQPTEASRVSVVFGVEYGCDPDEVIDCALNAINGFDVADEPEPKVVFNAMGDSAVEFKALFWVSSYEDAVPMKHDVSRAIYEALQEADIGIPYPTRTVHLNDRR